MTSNQGQCLLTSKKLSREGYTAIKKPRILSGEFARGNCICIYYIQTSLIKVSKSTKRGDVTFRNRILQLYQASQMHAGGMHHTITKSGLISRGKLSSISEDDIKN